MTPEQQAAMRQALEALDALIFNRPYEGRFSDAITALRRALQSRSDVEQQPADDWEHLKQYGYAPGNYMMTCRECDKEVIDVDKRASRCRTCAEAMYAKRQQPAVSDQPADEPVAWWIPKHAHPDMVSRVKWSSECEPLYTRPQPADEPVLKPRTGGCTLCGYCAATGERIKAVRHEQPTDHIVNANKMVEQQPADEPVGHFYLNTVSGYWHQLDKQAWPNGSHVSKPLYTHPQPAAQAQDKPAWVGLTDEEVQEVRNSLKENVIITTQAFYRAIEAKLREKNGGKA